MKRVKYVPEYDHEPFSTYDLGCSAALVSLGYRLIKVSKKMANKSLFLFDWSEKLVESAQQYWCDELQVNALAYFNALKNLKNRLHSS